MVPEGRSEPLRRLRDAVRPASGDRGEEHLHYDRGARTWRTHAELGARGLATVAVAVAQEPQDPQGHGLQECA
jgi:hypothetical protein